MPPSAAVVGLPNRRESHAVSFRETHEVRAGVGPDGPNGFGRKLSQVMLCAALRIMRRRVRTASAPTLARHVVHIFLVRADEEMIRVHTRREVASMTDVGAIWNRATKEFV